MSSLPSNPTWEQYETIDTQVMDKESLMYSTFRQGILEKDPDWVPIHGIDLPVPLIIKNPVTDKDQLSNPYLAALRDKIVQTDTYNYGYHNKLMHNRHERKKRQHFIANGHKNRHFWHLDTETPHDHIGTGDYKKWLKFIPHRL